MDHNCKICKSTILNLDPTYLCHHCKSYFHYNHLMHWFLKNDKCPMCKNKIWFDELIKAESDDDDSRITISNSSNPKIQTNATSKNFDNTSKSIVNSILLIISLIGYFGIIVFLITVGIDLYFLPLQKKQFVSTYFIFSEYYCSYFSPKSYVIILYMTFGFLAGIGFNLLTSILKHRNISKFNQNKNGSKILQLQQVFMYIFFFLSWSLAVLFNIRSSELVHNQSFTGLGGVETLQLSIIALFIGTGFWLPVYSGFRFIFPKLGQTRWEFVILYIFDLLGIGIMNLSFCDY